MTVLKVTSLSKRFGARTVVKNVSFNVSSGQMVALIGPNGAGKTTTFNMINGQLQPDSGRVYVNGIDVTGATPDTLARAGVGRTFQVAETFRSMTVLENVQTSIMAHDRLGARIAFTAMTRYTNKAYELLSMVGMDDQASVKCSHLSYGDVKRVEFAMALAGKPRLLLMDEPTAGMSPSERKDVISMVKRVASANGIAVLFTEHSMDVVFDYADRVIVLAGGTIIEQGSVSRIQQSSAVREVYFGLGGDQQLQDTINRSANQPVLLSVENLNAWYGAAQILFDMNFHVHQGEVVALIGRNGAGKSTTFKAIVKQVKKSTGKVSFMDSQLSALSAHAIARLGLGYVPGDRRVFTDLTVIENLRTGEQPVRKWPDGSLAPSWSVNSIIELFPNLGNMLSRQGDQMSGGEQQMLAIARTLMGNPYMILLDEPSEGVAPIVVNALVQAIVRLKSEGVSILLAEQNLEFASKVADRVYMLEKGVIKQESNQPKELLGLV